MLGIFHDSLWPFSLRQSPSFKPKSLLADTARLVSQLSQESLVFAFWDWGYTLATMPTQHFTWLLGTLTLVLTLVWLSTLTMESTPACYMGYVPQELAVLLSQPSELGLQVCFTMSGLCLLFFLFSFFWDRTSLCSPVLRLAKICLCLLPKCWD